MIKLTKLLNEAEESFTATNKASGKTSVFKSKASRDAAVKAGTHDVKKATSSTGGNAKSGVNIFDEPAAGSKKAKDDKSKVKVNPADLGVDKVVYNTRTNTVGIVRLGDERGETKTDADGNVNTSELEPYNPMKYPHQKDAKTAPSTQKEIDAKGLWNPFAPTKSEPKKDEPTSEPKKIKQSNPAVNKATKSKAEQLGITPQKLGKDEYQKKMAQAAVEALTDSNYHSEARALIASLEGKPEWAEKPTDMPSMSSPEYGEWRKNSVYSSEYYDADEDTSNLGQTASQESGWSGDDAVAGIAFTLRMNGFGKLADTIQSVIKEGKRTSLKNLMK